VHQCASRDARYPTLDALHGPLKNARYAAGEVYCVPRPSISPNELGRDVLGKLQALEPIETVTEGILEERHQAGRPLVVMYPTLFVEGVADKAHVR
jgi:hypothetical protein